MQLYVMQTHGIAVTILSVCPSVRLSVCLSVRRVYCDKPKWCTADILIPHETAITLVFWKWTTPLRKTPTSTDFRL